jgi:hypothetical protein
MYYTLYIHCIYTHTRAAPHSPRPTSPRVLRLLAPIYDLCSVERERTLQRTPNASQVELKSDEERGLIRASERYSYSYRTQSALALAAYKT